MPRLLLLWFTLFTVLHGASLEDAVKSVARGLSARLAAGETVQITARNLTALPAQELEKAHTLLQRAMRRSPARNKPPFDVHLYLSESATGFVLIAELRHGPQRFVEMAPFDAAPTAVSLRPVLTRRIIRQQNTPLLDVAVFENRMLVLSARTITLHEQRDGKWEPLATKPLASPPTRDPRGSLEFTPPTFRAVISGATCEGVLQPELDITCSSSPQTPPDDAVLLSSGLTLKSTPDGRLQVFNTQQDVVSSHEGLGSAIALSPETCGAKSLVFHTAQGDWYSPDTLSLHDWSTGKPIETGNRLEFSSPITELKPYPGGTLAITANHAEESYSAYLVTVDCSR